MSQNFDKLQVYKSKLSGEDFKRIAMYVEKELGIKMPPHKIIMVQNRLYRRLIHLKIQDFSQYVKFIFSPQGKSELEELANVLTTNKTDFFRESDHFDVLRDIAAGRTDPLKIWSAACSTGEEVYSIAITLILAGKSYYLLGSDISDSVLQKAQEGIYPEAQAMTAPKEILDRFFKKTVIANRTYYKVNPALKRNIEFKKINLTKPKYPVPDDFDVIFLRNVLIYFNSGLQLTVIRHVLRHLKPGGYLFLGHSESILDFSLPIERVAPSVYRKL